MEKEEESCREEGREGERKRGKKGRKEKIR